MRLPAGIFLGFSLLSLASCAPPASQVAPIFVVPPPFFGRSCEQLAASRARLTNLVLLATLRQNTLSKADQTRTLGIPTPLGTPFEENREFELGVLKGQLIQLEDIIRREGCEAL